MSKVNTATKQAAQAIPVATATNPKDRGTRHEGVIDKIETTSYRTGSFGLKLKYVVTGVERPVYENIILRKNDEEGNLINTKYGIDSFKRRLQAFGYTSEDILAFPIPKKVTDNAEFSDILGATVTVYLRDRKYMGKLVHDIASVWPLDTNGNR